MTQTFPGPSRKKRPTGTGRREESWFGAAYERMNRRFGDLRWWPAETPFEMAVGAILTQNTAWTNVEQAITNLKNAGLLDPWRLCDVDPLELGRIIRPAGYFNVKAKRLKSFLAFLHDRYEGRMEQMFRQDTDSLRRELLSVKGIGEETADSILLYGDNRPLFVVDAYTRRILERHGIIGEGLRYGDIQRLFMDNPAVREDRYNQYHALIVNTGKQYCRSKPECDDCPLKGLDPTVSRETVG